MWKRLHDDDISVVLDLTIIHCGLEKLMLMLAFAYLFFYTKVETRS